MCSEIKRWHIELRSMEVSQIVFLGRFHSAPQLSLLHTLVPGYPLKQHSSLTEITPDTFNAAIVITDVDWLHTLSESDSQTLIEQMQNKHCWFGVSDSDTAESRLLPWLKQGIDLLLPRAFELPLLNHLTIGKPVRQPIALVLTTNSDNPAQLTEILRQQGYSVLYHPAESSLLLCLQEVEPHIIIVQDQHGIQQLKLAQHQLRQLEASLIGIIDASEVITEYLPDDVQLMNNKDLSLLPRLLKQYKNPYQREMLDRNRAYFTRIAQLLQVLGDEAIISRTNRSGKITQANGRFCSISGYTEEELKGQTHRIIKSDLHPATFFKSMWQRLASGKVWHGVVCNRNKQGLLYWISTRMFPISNAQGQIDSYICISSDISAMQHDRQRLQQLTELFQVEQVHNAPWHCDLRSGRIYWSHRALKLLDITEDQTPANLQELSKVIHPADRLNTIQTIGRSIRSQCPFELKLRFSHSGHSPRWFAVTGYPIHDEENRPIQLQGVFKESKGPDLQATHSEIDTPLFQQLFYASEHCMAISDPQGYVLFTNPAYQRVMGFNEDEIVGRHCSELISSDQSTARHLSSQLLEADQPWQGITTRQRKDGSEFTAANLFGPIRNEAGQITHLFTTFADISQDVQAHQALSADRDAALQASLSKSEFLSRFGHELRTPLNSVLGFAQLLEQDDQLSSLQKEQVQAILGAGRHLLDVINSILDLSRIEAGKVTLSYTRVDIHQVVSECYELLGSLAGEKRISLGKSGLTSCHLVTDRLRMKQVLLNLISNALLYTQKDGAVEVTAELIASNRVRIVVSDNGPGISPHQVETIFQPYKRLHQTTPTQPGTGIGLAICHQLIELMQGEIGVSSQLGLGSSFWLELPMQPALEQSLIKPSESNTCQLFETTNPFHNPDTT